MAIGIVGIALLAGVVLFLLWWFLGGEKVEAVGPTILENLKPIPPPPPPKTVENHPQQLNEYIVEDFQLPQGNEPQETDEYVAEDFQLPSEEEPPFPDEFVTINIPPRTTPRLDGWVPPYARNRNPSLGEKYTCEALERIYGVPFKSVWPQWLVNPETGERMEIDCYNDDLMLGGEYNGEQHYKFPNGFHDPKKDPNALKKFKAQVRRDSYKRQLCDLYGVFLIPVPYYIKHHDIERHIREYLPENILARSHGVAR